MKSYRQLVSLLLLAAMLLSSCGKPAGGDDTDPVTEGETTVNEVTETAPDLPDVTFAGEEFRIMYRHGAHEYNIEDIWVEDLNGEVINDAVYERNLALEEKFKVKITPMPETSPVKQLSLNVLAGDDFCEILADRKIELFPLTVQNYAWNLKELRYIDFAEPWWDTNMAEQMTIGDSLYMMAGDFNLSSTTGATFIWFNKKIMTDNGIDMPYKLVNDGKWTIDRMKEMITAVSEDLNGDGKMRAGDRFGFLTQVPYRMLSGFGVQMTSRDDTNFPVLRTPDDRMYRSMEIISGIMNDKEHTISYDEMASGQDTSGYPHIYAFGRSKFAENQLLFFEGGISAANEFREMTSPYGIIPMPKLDEDQERYYNLVDEYATGWVIPSSSAKTEMTDILLEYMAYASSPLVDAVYEITLKSKRMDSPDDSEMLDLIRASTLYEITFVMNVGIRQMLEKAVASGNLASAFAADKDAISAKLEGFRTTAD